MKQTKKNSMLFLFLLVFSVSFLSCSKDDEAYSLSGTTWENLDGTVLETIKFDQTTCTYTISSTVLSTKISLSYDYTIAYPKVYMEAQTTGYADLESTVSGENMIVVNTSKSTTIGTFIKQ
jgi:hypothetical protein